jgi:hypothetical protein
MLNKLGAVNTFSISGNFSFVIFGPSDSTMRFPNELGHANPRTPQCEYPKLF